MLKTAEKVHFLAEKARPILVALFVPSLFPFCLKMAKICCFCLSKSQNVGRKRGLRLKNIRNVHHGPPRIFLARQLATGKFTDVERDECVLRSVANNLGCEPPSLLRFMGVSARKKILTPPPPNSPQTPFRPLTPPAPPSPGKPPS